MLSCSFSHFGKEVSAKRKGRSIEGRGERKEEIQECDRPVHTRHQLHSHTKVLFGRYWSLILWALGLSKQTAGVGGGSLAMLLYGAAGGLMWIRSLEFVLVQEMLGQVPPSQTHPVPCTSFRISES